MWYKPKKDGQPPHQLIQSFYIFTHFRLDVKSVSDDQIEVIYDSNLIQEVEKINIWNHIEAIAWKVGIWETLETLKKEGLNVVLLKSLEKGHIYDVRLIGLGKDRKIKVLTRDGVKVKGLFKNSFNSLDTIQGLCCKVCYDWMEFYRP